MVMLWIDIIETTRRPRTSAPTSRTPIELLNNQKRLMFVSSLAVGRNVASLLDGSLVSSSSSVNEKGQQIDR